MAPSKYNRSTGYFELSLAAFIWGSVGVFIKFLHLPVLVIVFYRVAFASMAGLTIISLLKLWSKLSLKFFPWRTVVMGAILGFNWMAFF